MLELANPAFLADPYPTYRRLREETPVARVRVGGGEGRGGREVWALSRYDDCVAALREPRFELPSVVGWVSEALRDGPAAGILPRLLAAQDPREPNRARARLMRCFTPCALDAQRPRAREVVEQVLDRAEQKGSLDLVEDFALPISVLTIAELLGVPSEDCELLRTWAPEAARMLEPASQTPQEIADCHAATESLWVYFEEHVRRRRALPDADLLSRLVGACDAEGVCGDGELVAFCVQLLSLGYRTCESLIAGGAYALARHPDAARRLRRDSALVVPAVEECARWDSPVQMTGRVAVEDLLFAGVPFEAGEPVCVLIGSANRDGEIFENPEVLDLARCGAPHLTFGVAPRPFLGSHMARMQAQIALRQLVRRFPELRPADGTEYRPSLFMRSLRHCPVTAAE